MRKSQTSTNNPYLDRFPACQQDQFSHFASFGVTIQNEIIMPCMRMTLFTELVFFKGKPGSIESKLYDFGILQVPESIFFLLCVLCVCDLVCFLRFVPI